uniref:Uncharacterized protein n=1 Tax=Arundo donax TaxID=35708 RepID=A0A0A8YRR1_ARUDO
MCYKRQEFFGRKFWLHVIPKKKFQLHRLCT